MSSESGTHLDGRRSHSYDESFLYYNGEHPSEASSGRPPLPSLASLSATREGPPLTKVRDDIGVGTTLVSPLGRFRGPYDHNISAISIATSRAYADETFSSRQYLPTVVSPDDNDSVPFDQVQDTHWDKSAACYQTMSPPDRSVRPFDEDSCGPVHSDTYYHKPKIQSRVHGPHRSLLAKEQQHYQQQEQQINLPDPAQRFRLPPVRVSRPSLDAGVEDEGAPDDERYYSHADPPQVRRITQQTSKIARGELDSQYSQSDPPLSPLSARASIMAHPPDSPVHARMRGIEDAYEEFGIGNGSISSLNNTTKGNTTEEDDSIFDFVGKPPQRQPSKELLLTQQHHRRSTKNTKGLPPGDETSEEGTNEPVSSLTLRAQEAWKRKSARERKAKPETNVSFTTNDPTVHRYAEYTENSTLAGVSLNSEYTKSMESEVEDAIKDIFLIGTGRGNHPGRRKLKYRPDMRRMRREKTQNHDDDTLETVDDNPSGNRFVLEGVPKKNTKAATPANASSLHAIESITPREEKKDADDALLGAWSMVESGLQAMGAAFGIDGTDDETMTFDDSRQEYDSDTLETDRRASPQAMRTRGDGNKASRKSSVDEPYDSSVSQSRNSSGDEKIAPSQESRNILGYFSGAFLGNSKTVRSDTTDATAAAIVKAAPKKSRWSVSSPPEDSKMSRPNSTKGAAAAPAKKKSVLNTQIEETGLPSLDKDLRLIELAVQSARSYHSLRGVVYDESDVDIVTDIKFIVVDLNLPLGLIFQENNSGCWVTKILAEGSAIKKSICVGDQLAAIDGKSAIGLKVDDIALAIRQKHSIPFELTFLRYVGPLRAKMSEVEEEGYEIAAGLLESGKMEDRRRYKDKHSLGASKKGQSSELEDSPTREKRRFRFFGKKK